MNVDAHTFEIRHAHFFCGLGGGAKGFNAARADIGTARARFRCLGGIDNDPAAVRDFERLTGVAGTMLDLFDRDQYRAFHGCEPPPGWREATTADIHSAFNNEAPNVIFLSAPCKAFSGLMPQSLSQTVKYQALNRLTLRGIWLMLEAYADNPVELIIFENVPLIKSRGRQLLDQIGALLRRYGYVVNETTHDCGELGELAQSRKRFLLVARHAEKIPSFLYEPTKRPLRAVGEVLGRMPLPGTPSAGPMHRIPALKFKTWARLAFVEAGKDWRSLNRLAIEDGCLRDYLIVPEYHPGYCGVREWSAPTGAVTGRSLPTNGAFSVADPRAPANAAQYSQYGVLEWDDTSGAIIGVKSPGQGTFSVADPRCMWSADAHRNKYRIVPWSSHAGVVTGADRVSSGALAVSDPRASAGFEGKGKYRVTHFDETAGTVIARSDTGQGAYAVADPRVVGFEQPSACITSGGHPSAGGQAVAGPRLPDANANVVCVIRSLDGTWHRPFTTLELAALQSLIDPEEKVELDGLSDQAWRERIGNAVPPRAAQAIAEEMGRTLLLAWTGQTFALGNTPIWVRDVAVAIAMPDTTHSHFS